MVGSTADRQDSSCACVCDDTPLPVMIAGEHVFSPHPCASVSAHMGRRTQSAGAAGGSPVWAGAVLGRASAMSNLRCACVFESGPPRTVTTCYSLLRVQDATFSVWQQCSATAATAQLPRAFISEALSHRCRQNTFCAVSAVQGSGFRDAAL